MVEHFPERSAASEDSGEADTRIIIDAGPDFRYQMLRERVMSIDAILLTHEHKDHIAGIDDIRAFNYFNDKIIPIYAIERTAAVVRKDFDYAFAEPRYPGAPEIDLHIVEPGRSFTVGSMDILPVAGMHYRLPVTGYRVGELAYLTDFNAITDGEVARIKGVEVLVINALRFEKHISHFSVEEAIEVSRRVGAKHTYLTHMSHQIGLHKDVEHRLPEGITYAFDGLQVNIPTPNPALQTPHSL
jgi:phosphoribosyl 1,2-cyclic phosphate phosphodiesterase